MDMFNLSCDGLTVLGSVLKVKTESNDIVSRAWNTASLVGVSAELLHMSLRHPTAAAIGGLTLFGTRTARSAALLGMRMATDQDKTFALQLKIAKITPWIAIPAAAAAQLAFCHTLDLRTVFPAVGVVFDSRADQARDMRYRRRQYWFMDWSVISYGATTLTASSFLKNLIGICSNFDTMRKKGERVPLAEPVRSLANRACARLAWQPL